MLAEVVILSWPLLCGTSGFRSLPCTLKVLQILRINCTMIILQTTCEQLRCVPKRWNDILTLKTTAVVQTKNGTASKREASKHRKPKFRIFLKERFKKYRLREYSCRNDRHMRGGWKMKLEYFGVLLVACFIKVILKWENESETFDMGSCNTYRTEEKYI